MFIHACILDLLCFMFYILTSFQLLYCNILSNFHYNLRTFHEAGDTKVLGFIFFMVKIKYLFSLCFILIIYVCILDLLLFDQGLCFMFYILTSSQVLLHSWIFHIPYTIYHIPIYILYMHVS